ncbi:hypothetical protein ANANG_G00310190 [Anguilla anguilla]|uniref:Uncharacterized protein n=1 Tax=Anguilla anguilla TaxID=7936 RepID=A0A9D3RJQ5_ANGAN|nr:hypothetical protein ANANG_G00310190 [Anguilla anguilla]
MRIRSVLFLLNRDIAQGSSLPAVRQADTKFRASSTDFPEGDESLQPVLRFWCKRGPVH